MAISSSILVTQRNHSYPTVTRELHQQHEDFEMRDGNITQPVSVSEADGITRSGSIHPKETRDMGL